MEDFDAIVQQIRQKETWLRAILDSAAELSRLSRDMRSATNPARGCSDFLAQNHVGDHERQRAGLFKHAVLKLVSLEDEIIDLTNIESGDFKLEMLEFDLHSAVRQTIDRVRLGLPSKSLTLRPIFSTSLLRAFSGDAFRLQNVLEDLLESAVLRTRSGEIVLRVEPDPGDPFHIFMEMTSLSIEPELQNGADGSQQSWGQELETAPSITDLKLDFCKKLVQQMGGDLIVGVNSSEGRMFALDVRFLPVRESTGHALNQSSKAAKITPMSVASPVRILICEDSEDSRFLLHEFLSGGPYDLTFAENGKVAVELTQQKTFDLILMDIQMPVMDGLTATRLIRKAEQEAGKPATPLLALTANSRRSDIELSMAAGCDAHILKPVSKPGLLNAIQEHISPERFRITADCLPIPSHTFCNQDQGSAFGIPAI